MSKRKETTIEGYVNLYPQDFYATRELADLVKGETRLGEPHYIKHTCLIDVEDDEDLSND